MGKKRMAFVDLCNYADWPMGGMLQYELQILETLTEQYQVDLWGVRVDGKSPDPVIVKGRSYPVQTFAHVRRGRRLIPNFWRGLALGKNRRAFAPYDIIYVHTGSCAVAAAWRLKTENNLLVYHQHGLQYLSDASLKTLLQRPFMKLAQETADFSFVVTGPEELKAYAKTRRQQERLVAVGSPVNTAVPKEERQSSPLLTFLYAGRLAPIKRVPLLVDLFGQFCRRHEEDCRLLIVGDGEEHEAVRRAIESNGLQPQVRLTGAVAAAEVASYLRQADVFLTASAGEGVSLAVLEAYAAGLPVVCFSVPGLQEQVRDGHTGAVAREGDKEGFLTAMERVADQRQTLSAYCREEASRYSKETIGAQIAAEIERRYEKNQRHFTGL